MNTLTNKTKFTVILPGVISETHYSGKLKNIYISIEKVALLGKQLDLPVEEVHLIIEGYFIALGVGIFTAQSNELAKLRVPQTRGATKQKQFQQTNSHGFMTAVIAKTPAVKALLAGCTVLNSINRSHYGIGDSESNDTEIKETASSEYFELRDNKGSGNLKTAVRSPEDRMLFMKGYMSSMRSTINTTPTFAPNSLVSNGTSLKRVDIELLTKVRLEVYANLVKLGIIDYEPDDMKTSFAELIPDTISRVIDDSPYGTIPPCNLDDLFGITRLNDDAPTPKKTESDFLKSFMNPKPLVAPERTTKSKKKKKPPVESNINQDPTDDNETPLEEPVDDNEYQA